jgi:hypothetical protein
MLGQTRSTMPPLRGVVHSAIEPGEKLMVFAHDEAPEATDTRMRAKVYGAWNLHTQLAKPEDLDFLSGSWSQNVWGHHEAKPVRANRSIATRPLRRRDDSLDDSRGDTRRVPRSLPRVSCVAGLDHGASCGGPRHRGAPSENRTARGSLSVSRGCRRGPSVLLGGRARGPDGAAAVLRRGTRLVALRRRDDRSDWGRACDRRLFRG